ncbi:hypothetical protein [Motiliproteus sediminis]|uniref:hypothetical protein n=1 Tax=Motiliproteus sediminis TaxID=1468178 RepID=UPI001AEFCE72|nr:hypothetical protein [Motiliproteus sediminis]
MKIFNKAALATAVTLFALNVSVAEANPWVGYKGNKIGYTNSYNNTNNIDTRVDNSQRFKRDYRLDYKLDNSRRTKIDTDTRIDLKYDIRNDRLNAKQDLNSFRNYSSGVNQNAFNAGAATGHSMNQSQGSTSVGSLVSDTATSNNRGHRVLSPSYSIHSGDVAKGNMSGSQIGGIQSGMQVGDVTNLQQNTQAQDATSAVASSDVVSNNVAK